VTIRLIALDLDGTLVDSHGQIPDVNRTAIARALDAGVEIVLATGRRYDFARPLFEQLPGPLTLILSNGAIVKTRDGATLMCRLLSKDVARVVLERAADHRGTAALIFDRPSAGQVVFETINMKDRRHRVFVEANRPFISEVSPLEDALTEDPVQIMFTGECAPMRGLIELLDSGSHGYSVALTEYARRNFSLVDVVQAGCSKGSALRDWTRTRGLTPDEVMAIGDNLNDVEMLEYAGLAVVMGNGLDELKARGWAVTGTNDDGGAASAIETFVLGRASY
jgi:Cof subfamily protein (haloacid dehalogenase superfamily)